MVRIIRDQDSLPKLVRLEGLTNHAFGIVNQAIHEKMAVGFNKLNRYFTELGGEILLSQGGIFSKEISEELLQELDLSLREYRRKELEGDIPKLPGSLFILPLDKKRDPAQYSDAAVVYVLDTGETTKPVLNRFSFKQLLEYLLVVSPVDNGKGYTINRLQYLVPGYTETFIRSYLNTCGLRLAYTIE